AALALGTIEQRNRATVDINRTGGRPRPPRRRVERRLLSALCIVHTRGADEDVRPSEFNCRCCLRRLAKVPQLVDHHPPPAQPPHILIRLGPILQLEHRRRSSFQNREEQPEAEWIAMPPYRSPEVPRYLSPDLPKRLHF